MEKLHLFTSHQSTQIESCPRGSNFFIPRRSSLQNSGEQLSNTFRLVIFVIFSVIFCVKRSPRWFFKSLHMWSGICSWPNCYLFTTTHAGDYGDVNDGKKRCPLDTPTWCICKWATAKWIKGEGCNEVSEAYDGLSSLAYYLLNLRMSDGKLLALQIQKDL